MPSNFANMGMGLWPPTDCPRLLQVTLLMAGLGVLRGRVVVRGRGVGGARGRALLHPVEDGLRGQGAAALRGRGRDPLRRESLGDKAENIYSSLSKNILKLKEREGGND